MKPIYLLDTNIYSELAKPEPNSTVVQKVIKNQRISAISVVAWAESLYGVKRLPEGAKKASLEDFLLNRILPYFEVLPFDQNCAWIYTDLRVRLEQNGTPMPDADLKIASAAISNGMILVTRNTKDFAPLKNCSTLAILNWFSEE
ncbi:PIN domain-containing protein [Treponema zioleckii]|uniref:PIN domain-containing protein n=1 Tax=Treponema zioleckii TaxID=331680 RepID=UPI00168B8545|nr:PIN domain-containing protein [Treponema zioleckii]